MSEIGCIGKLRYGTRSEAEQVRKQVRRRRKGDPDAASLQAYHCPNCGGFHIGRDKRVSKVPHLKTRAHYAKTGKKLMARYLDLLGGKP